jgi:uncharacterized protein (TIGR02284 family)
MPLEASMRSSATDAFVEQLATLQTRLVDALSGYQVMQEKAEPEIQPIVAEYVRTHTRHEQELSSRLVALGQKPDEDGSFFSLVQEAVVRTRSLFSDLGTNVLPQVLDGEESLLEVYRDTLQQADGAADRDLLERQMQQLQALNEQTRSRATV